MNTPYSPDHPDAARLDALPEFVIYRHTSPSGKCYVGQTRSTMQKRWAAHIRDAREGSTLPFHRAIVAYGPDSFTHDILETARGVREANQAEQRWIASLNCQKPNGYNIEPGGNEFVRSEETRRKLSEATSLRLAAMTPDQRKAHCAHMAACMTKEQKSLRGRNANAARDPAEKVASGRKNTSGQSREQRIQTSRNGRPKFMATIRARYHNTAQMDLFK